MEYTKELLEDAHEFLERKGVRSMGDNINAFIVERYLVEFALKQANGVDKSSDSCHIQNVNQQRELLAAFQNDYNKRNFEDALIADIDIELFLAANSG